MQSGRPVSTPSGPTAPLNNAEVIDRIDELAAEWPDDDALALFEKAGARDSAGLEAQAEPLYRRALQLGLPESERAQAMIQLASTIRNLGRIDESLALLRDELAYERPTANWPAPQRPSSPWRWRAAGMRSRRRSSRSSPSFRICRAISAASAATPWRLTAGA